MGLFDKLREPVFLKNDSRAEDQLAQLRALYAEAPAKIRGQIGQQIRCVEAGIEGEKNIEFELKNSHFPMFVLHDLYVVHGGLSAQIDYLLVTKGVNVYVECKNLFGDIEIDQAGNFIRTFRWDGKTVKEGIYSPITQNQRHMELVKQIGDEKSNLLVRALRDRGFFRYNRSAVVLANPKTILNDRFAPKEIRRQVMRADRLVAYIRQCNEELTKEEIVGESAAEKQAKNLLLLDTDNPVDYTKRFRELMAAAPEPEAAAEEAAESPADGGRAEAPKDAPAAGAAPRCPVCGAPMVLRTARKGPSAGKQFYGCSKYPHCRGTLRAEETGGT